MGVCWPGKVVWLCPLPLVWQCQEPREPHKGQLPPEHQEADVVPDCLAMEGVGLYGRPLCVKTPPSVVDPHVSEPIGCVMI